MLENQIASLQRAASGESDNYDLQLLLGYQLLGTNKLDEASERLRKAGEDAVNKESAESLLDMVEKLRGESAAPEIEPEY